MYDKINFMSDLYILPSSLKSQIKNVNLDNSTIFPKKSRYKPLQKSFFVIFPFLDLSIYLKILSEIKF